MMNYIYEPFPDTVMLNGSKRYIVTDFKAWLKYYDMLRDGSLSDIEKFELMRSYYFSPLTILDMKNLHKPLISFFKMETDDNAADHKADEVETDHKKPLYDFCFDSAYIIAGFYHDYRIDLTTAHMHWWKFRLLLDGLSKETEFKQRVMYRNIDLSQIKDQKERQRIQRIQRAIAIPEPAPTDYETGDIFW